MPARLIAYIMIIGVGLDPNLEVRDLTRVAVVGVGFDLTRVEARDLTRMVVVGVGFDLTVTRGVSMRTFRRCTLIILE
jgi:hypothetical protein